MNELNDRITSFGIRNRILIFAILVTLTPTLGMGWVFHNHTKKLLKEKAELEMYHMIHQARQQARLWCKESSLSLQIISNSFIISENLEYFVKARQRRDSDAARDIAIAIAALQEYLEMLQPQFKEYKSLHIFDYNGNLVIKSPSFSNTKIVNIFPEKWLVRLKHDSIIIKELDDDKGYDETRLMIATAVFSDKRKMLGALAVELSIDKLIDVISPVDQKNSTLLSLVNKNGVTLVSQSTIPDASRAIHTLSKKCSIYRNAQNTKVVGIYAPLETLSWVLNSILS